MSPKYSYHRPLFYCLVVSYVTYFTIGILYPGETAGKVALFVYVGICGVFMLGTVLEGQLTWFVSLWLLLLTLILIGFVIAPEVNIQSAGDNYFASLRTIVFVSVSFFPFYHLARKNTLDGKDMLRLSVILCVLFSFNFFYEQEKFYSMGTVTEQVDEIYGLVFLLPFLFLIKRRVLVYAALAILFVMVVSSLKRGALTTFIIGAIVVVYWAAFRAGVRLTLGRVITGLMALSISVLFAYYAYTNNELFVARFDRLETDSASGRLDRVWPPLIDAWVDAPTFLNQIFGYGYAGTFTIAGISAHNDLLEMMVNFGIVGVVIYVGLWIDLFRIYKSNNLDLPLKYALLAILLMWMLNSQYSHWYNLLYSSASIMMLGYILGNVYKQRFYVES